MTGILLIPWLGAVAMARPEHPALAHGPNGWSYKRFWRRSEGVARAIRARRDFKPGMRVALSGSNSPEYLVAYFGILRASGVTVPLNDRLAPEELLEQLDFVEAAGCILCDGENPLAGELEPAKGWNLAELDAGGTRALEEPGPTLEATVLLTSGSTGSPKGVVHTHRTLSNAAFQMATSLPFAADDVNLAFLPFFASIPEQILPTLLCGGAIDILPRFDAEAVAAGCDRATTFDSVPTLVARLLDHGDFERLNQLRWIAFASEPMPAPVLERWWERVPDVATHEFYGMTEMLTIAHATDETLRSDPSVVGRPFATSLVRVVDEQLKELSAGSEGEIVCRSPAQMSGYLRDPGATEAALCPDGSIRTGDLGRIESDGRLHLSGRLKDLIISGGFNIAPAEIEAAACRHPNVSAAAAIGIPDERWGETPVIVGVPTKGDSLSALQLLSHCRSELTSFKRPSAAAVIEHLPVTGIGKSAKAQLREAILKGRLDLVRDL